MSHVSHMNESCLPHVHLDMQDMTRARLGALFRMSHISTCLTCLARVMSHISTCLVSHMSHISTCLMCLAHVSHINMPDVSHISTCRISHMSHTSTCLMCLARVMSRMKTCLISQHASSLNVPHLSMCIVSQRALSGTSHVSHINVPIWET